MEKLQIVYHDLFNEYLPKSGEIFELAEDRKVELIDLRDKLRLLREKIFELEDNQQESKEYLKYLQDLKNKFTDESLN